METRSLPTNRKCCATDCLSVVAGTRFDEAGLSARAAALNALGDQVRLKILTLLAQHDSLCVCEIQQAFDIGQPTVSHHLRILREAGLVDVHRRGTWAYYSLRRGAIEELSREMAMLAQEGQE